MKDNILTKEEYEIIRKSIEDLIIRIKNRYVDYIESIEIKWKGYKRDKI